MKHVYMRRMLAALMTVAALLAALAGCGKKSDEELIVGQWSARIDVSEPVRDLVLSFDGDYEAVDFDGLTLNWRAVFNEDGTYTAAIAADGVAQLKADIAERMVPVVKERVRSELAKEQKVSPDAITDEQLDGYVGMIGLGTWADMCGLYLEMVNVDALFEGDGFAGKYLLRSGELCLTGMPDTEPGDESWSAPYRVDDRTLTLESGSTDGLPDFLGSAFPMTLTRLK